MNNVQSILDSRDNQIWSIGQDDTVYDAIKLMDEKGIGALPVLQDERLIGIISERDYARKVILRGRSSKQTTVKEIMTHTVYTVSAETGIEQCMVIMTQKNIRHLPVLSGDKLIAIISLGDVVRQIIREQRYTIEQLENTLSWSESY